MPQFSCNANGSLQVKERLVVEDRFRGRQNLTTAAFVNGSAEASAASRFKMTPRQCLKSNQEHRRVRVDSRNLARCLEAIHKRHA